MNSRAKQITVCEKNHYPLGLRGTKTNQNSYFSSYSYLIKFSLVIAIIPISLLKRIAKTIHFANIALCFIVIFFTILTQTQNGSSSELSVPAEFVMRLQPPGSNNDFLRPSDIFIDTQNGEVFVADPGNNRILIFDSTGTFLFEFEGAEYFSTPINIVVDSEGYIYVLGSTKEGRRVKKFDFDGLFLKELPLPLKIDDIPTDFSCLAIDENNILFLYEVNQVKIYSFDSEGQFLKSFNILPGLDDDSRKELVISSITVKDNKIYVPISSIGNVQIYDTDGKSLRSIGIQGNNVGEMNFPVKVKLLDNQLILVLDKHRINVICYSFDGKFLGEFGGKGSSPGWFYHPTLLEVNNQNQVYVGQIFENKIQLCQIPQFITDKVEKKQNNISESQEGANNGL